MTNYVNVLVATGSLCLLITLGLAWCLVGVRSSAVMKRVFPYPCLRNELLPVSPV